MCCVGTNVYIFPGHFDFALPKINFMLTTFLIGVEYFGGDNKFNYMKSSRNSMDYQAS